MNKWILISEKDGKVIKIGDKVKDFRGETQTIEGLFPPKKDNSCGHYKPIESGVCGTIYYVSCINAKFILDHNE